MQLARLAAGILACLTLLSCRSDNLAGQLEPLPDSEDRRPAPEAPEPIEVEVSEPIEVEAPPGAPPGAAAVAVTADWPHWRGPDRTGVSPDSGWSSAGAEAPLWSASVGRGYSAPSIENGRLFIRGFYEVADKLGEDVTACLDAETGEVLWTHASPSKLWDEMHGGGTLSTPTADGEAVYVLGRLGSLWALSSEDGSVLWEHDLAAELNVEAGFFGLSSSPVVLANPLIGDVVVINVGITAAFDKRTGERRWATKDYGYSYGTPQPFEWGRQRLLAVFNAVGLTILNEDTGAEVAVYDWVSDYNVNAATPIVMGNRLFISTGYHPKGGAMLELTDEGLSKVWANGEMNSLMNGCVLLDGHLFGFDRTRLKCLDLDGEALWSARGLGRGTVIAADGRLIVLSEEGELQIGAASPAGFEPTYTRQVVDEGPCWTTPVIARGRIYCRGAGGQLVCLDHRASR